MSRYQPAKTPSSVYISAQGKAKLAQEYNELWYKKRPKVTQSVREAAAQGDRSENAEYIYGKKQLREIDARLRFLKKRLDVLVVVEQLPDNQDKIFFGAYVTLENEAGELLNYQLVGADEFDLKQGKISIDSPLAKALLNKEKGDDIIFAGPTTKLHYYIEDVKYHLKEDIEVLNATIP